MTDVAVPVAPKADKKLRRRQVSLPADMKNELGISPDALTERAALEQMPEVQQALKDFEQQEEALVQATGAPHKPATGASPGVSHAKLEERNKKIVELYQVGLTPESIQKHVNNQAALNGWALLSTTGSINRIVSEYYVNQQPPVRELRAHEQGLKEAMFNGMSRMIEQMSLYIAKRNTKNDWKPFEYGAAMEALFRMRQNLVDNRNWNASKMNPLIAVQQNNTYISVYDKNAESVIENKKLLQPIIDVLDECLEDTAKAKAT